METVIRVVDLWKKYAQDGHEDAVALAGANVEIDAGQVVTLFGKSGSGKTTLLNILAGLDRPTRGTVELRGRDLANLGDAGLTSLRRTELGFVFQFFNLLPTLTALENVFLSLELVGVNDKTRAIEALAAVGLNGKEGRFPSELSGGEQQRVAIARAMVKQPSIILADEPTGNLDNKTGEQVLDLLQRQCRILNATLIMASHSPLTGRYADRILTMTDGIIDEQPTAGRRGQW